MKKKDLLELIKSSGETLKIIDYEARDVNILKLYGMPKVRTLIYHGISELMGDDESNCIAGRGTGGVALAANVSELQDKYLAMYTPKMKDINMPPFAGYAPAKGDIVAIVDDILSNNNVKGILKLIDSIEESGARISKCYFVLETGKPDLGVPYEYLLRTNEIFE